MKLEKIKKITKYLGGLVAAGALVSLVIFPALGMQANGPRFNWRAGDDELFTGAKVGTQDWTDPVSVTDGDTFAGKIYYHNGIENEVAVNTRIKVALPDAVKAGNNLLTASISADNAETVTDTVIDGVINGPTGLTIKADADMALDFVPGSVEWHPDVRQTGGAEKPLLFGQTGAELFGPVGLKIGDINGCWDFAGWVIFTARVHKVQVPELAIQKTVRNVTTDTAYVESVDVAQAEKANFKIVVTNTGDTDLDPVKVFDQLPEALDAVDGTGRLRQGEIVTPFALTDLLSATGVNLGLMHPGQSATLTFDAVPHGLIRESITVKNIAIAARGNLQKQDSACVVLIPGDVKIHLAKCAWNLTQNISAEAVPANPGDEIEYTLKTANSGTAPTDYIVRDNISDILEYADVTDLGGGLVNANGVIVYPEVPLLPATELVNHFIVRIRPILPILAPDGRHFDDKLENTYGNTVIVLICRPILRPSLVIAKFVRNVTANEPLFVKANTAFAGDALEYKIIFKNIGNAPADYIKITDLLPANVCFDPTAPVILGIDGDERAVAESMQAGFILNTLVPGQEASIRFIAHIANGVAADQVLVNTAFLTDDDITIFDAAQTIIRPKIVLIETTPTPIIPIPTLPRTGATDSIILSLLVAIGGTGSLAFVKSLRKR